MLALPAVAQAADPGRWTLTGSSAMPLYYYQGVTSDPAGHFYFDGIHLGLYRTDSALNEQARNETSSRPRSRPRGLQPHRRHHVGRRRGRADPAAARVLLPAAATPARRARSASPTPRRCGGATTSSSTRRYIAKAMWAEVSPDGKLIWTSSGNDLLAYRATRSSPRTPPRWPAAQARGEAARRGPADRDHRCDVPRGRLLVAGQDGGLFQVWSIDLATGARQLEIERTTRRVRGPRVADALGGLLHWQIQPYNEQGPPTYPPLDGTLLHFAPAP